MTFSVHCSARYTASKRGKRFSAAWIIKEHIAGILPSIRLVPFSLTVLLQLFPRQGLRLVEEQIKPRRD